MSYFIKFLSKYSWVILLLFIILGGLSFKPGIKLIGSVDTGLKRLLPDHHPSVKVGEEIDRKFFSSGGGGGGDLIVIVSSEEKANSLRLLKDLVKFYEKHPDVERVQFEKNKNDDDSKQLMFLEVEELEDIRDKLDRQIQRRKLGNLFIDLEESDEENPNDQKLDILSEYRERYQTGLDKFYYTNQEETDFAFWIYPKNKDTSLQFYQEFFDLISKYTQEFDFSKYTPESKIYYAGSIKTRIDEYSTLMGDLKIAGIISLSGIFLILMIYFRSVLAVLCLLIPLILSLIFTFKISTFFIDKLNIITSFLFSILLGLGVDVGIHLFSRFIEERKSGKSLEDSLYQMLSHTGRSASMGIITTMVIFIILITNDFKGFSEFGWIAALGLASTLFTFLVFFPALLSGCDRIEFLKSRILKARINSKESSSKKTFNIPIKKIFIMVSLAGLILTAFIPFSKFEWDYGALRMRVPQTVIAKEKLKLINPRVNRPAVLQIENEEDAISLKKYFKDIKNEKEELSPVQRFFSSYDLLPKNQDRKMEVLQEIDFLLSDDIFESADQEDIDLINEFRESIAKTRKVKPEEVTRESKKNFYGNPPYDNEQIAYVFPAPKLELDDGRNAINFFHAAHEVKLKNKTFYATSNSMIFADVLITMFSDIEKTVLISIIFILLIIFLDFRSVKRTLMIFLSLIFGLVTMTGLVTIFGWKFSFFNMVTLPVVLGMGVDNSIHFMHRYLETKSISEALSTTGRAGILATLTTMVGYSGLISAHHPGLESIGYFAVIGMACCLVGSFIFLPLFIKVFSNKRS